MNKVQIVLAIATIGIMLYIGGLVYYELVIELENNPDIKDIGGPPVITDLRLVTIIVVVAAIICGICLKLPVKEDDENNL